MQTLRPLGLFLALVTLTACIDGIEPARERTGFISAVSYDAGGGNYGMRVTAAFYKQDGLITGLLPADSCEGRPYNPNPGTVAFLTTLDAGELLRTLIGGRRDTLWKTSTSGILMYALQTVDAIPFTPGDTLELEIPGSTSGFPGTTLSVRTAEAFTYDPVGDPAEAQPLQLTWTPPPAPGALMVFSLRLNSTGVSVIPDAQIYCVFNDDGSGNVPAPLAAVWKAASVPSRQVAASRVRLDEHVFDGNTKVTLLSFFDRPLQPVPAP